MKEWTNNDLIEYVSKFKDVQRAHLLKQILENDHLQQSLGPTHGRMIFNGVAHPTPSDTILILQ